MNAVIPEPTPSKPAGRSRFQSLTARTRSWQPIDFAACGLTALCALAFYAQSLAPTVSVEDTGELIAAAYTLGIPHPTGYPLWVILAHAFQAALPIGEVAWRVNLFSAVCGAVACGLVTALGIRLHGNRLAATAGGLLLAVSREFWEQSVIAEVYTLNALLFIACLLILHHWHERPSRKRLFGFAFVLGLSMTVHSTMLLIAPVFAWFILWDRDKRPAWGAGLVALGCVAAGLSVYLYLPVRSLTNPLMDWGNPETPGNFWAVLTREQYSGIFREYPRSVGHFMRQTGVFLRVAGDQVNLLAWPFAIAGMGILARRNGRWGRLLLVLAGLLFVCTILIPNFPIEKKFIWINTPYWIPLYAIAAVWIGAALAPLARRWPGAIAVAAIFAAAFAFTATANLDHSGKRGYTISAEYGRAILQSLDRNAIYFGAGDHTIFPLVYLQIVEGVRPDVTIANPYGYVKPAMYRGMPEAERAGFGRYPGEEHEPAIMAWVMEDTDQPVYCALKRNVAGARAVPYGLVYRYVRPGELVPEAPASPAHEALYTRTITTPGWTETLILFDCRVAHARAEYDPADRDKALAILAEAEVYAAGDKECLNNLGAVYAEYGAYDRAEWCFEQALAIRPDFATAQRNLERLRAMRAG